MSEELSVREQFEDYDIEEREINVDPKQESTRIDKFIFDKVQNVSRNRVQSLIKAKGVTVNGELVKSNYKIRPNDQIVILLPKNPNVPKTVIPEDIPLDIRYEDEYLMVIYKPPGLVVHPGIGNYTGTLANGLVHYLDQQNIPVLEGNTLDRPGIVHRIDKDTSGLLVLAKEEFTLTHLARQFFNHTVERKYLALVWGDVLNEEGMIDEYIGRNPKDNLKVCVFPERDQGKHAITHYKLIENLYYVSLVECQLETGRTHQIRVHMKHKGHPIFGDTKYGGDRIVKGTVFGKYKQFVHNSFAVCPRQALHARTLGFEHPHTGERLLFEEPMPDDMKNVMDRWRNYLNNRKENVS